MIRNIDYGLRFETEPKHKRLYGWAIQEVDENGQRLGRDYIPWGLRSHFEIAELTIQRSFTIDDEFSSGGRLIRGVLVPLRDHRGNRPTYSLFGTKRTVPTIELFIEELRPSEKFPDKTAGSDGFVSYTDDDPIWGGKIAPDHMQINLYFLQDEFDEIFSMIEEGRADEGSLTCNLEGIYSEWTPDITTDQFKVLAGDERDQPLEVPTDFETPPTRLGKVSDVSFGLRKSQKLLPASDENEAEVAFNDEFENEDPDIPLEPIAQRSEKGVTKEQVAALQLSLWVIAALLLIGLFV